MKKFGLLIIGGVLAFYFRSNIQQLYWNVFNGLPQVTQKLSDELLQPNTSLNAPTPLRQEETAQNHSGELFPDNVIAWTNSERKKDGAAALTPNAALTRAALAKVNDMFKYQYFEHTAPDGTKASDLATRESYKFIIIGENLALGNFGGDKELVQAWMNSPGHRANILNKSYIDIGVAVKQGMFEGHMTWLAVQEFGKPSSVCPQADALLKASIDRNKGLLAGDKSQLDAKHTEIEQMNQKWGNEYNQKVTEFNALVDNYNTLIRDTKTLVDNYNTQVRAYNTCALQ